MVEQRRIRILLADDHLMVRRGIAAILDEFPDLELVGTAADGEEAIRLYHQLHPDVVVMDLLMPRMDGLEAIRQLRKAQPGLKCIALTSSSDELLVERAFKVGAIAYLLKDIDADDLAKAIRAAHAGVPTIAPEAIAALIDAVTRPPPPNYNLSQREQEVLTMIVAGLSNLEIAHRLHIHPSTAKTYVRRVLEKLGVTSRLEAVKVALGNHLVT